MTSGVQRQPGAAPGVAAGVTSAGGSGGFVICVADSGGGAASGAGAAPVEAAPAKRALVRTRATGSRRAQERIDIATSGRGVPRWFADKGADILSSAAMRLPASER